MKQNTIYLAGKMSNLSWEEMSGWRNEFKKYFADCPQIHIISPCDFYSLGYSEENNCTDEEVMDYDLWIVKNSEIIVVNLDFPDSIGTAIECYEAKFNCKIPVIAFGDDKNYYATHPWIRRSVTTRLKTMEEAVDFIKSFYLPHMI